MLTFETQFSVKLHVGQFAFMSTCDTILLLQII